MQAVVVRGFGGPEALEIVRVPTPTPGRGQVRITVAAAGVNPVDAYTRAGGFPELAGVDSSNHIGIGWDVAGVVDELGPDVAEFAIGDRVIGLRDRIDQMVGAYAEKIVLDAAAVAPAPAGADLVAAATLPLNALTAAQALDVLSLPAGKTVLVTGAAGGLGGFAVELAALRGLRVVAVSGEADEQTVRGFGAEFFVPRNAALATAVRELIPGGVDAALDAALIGAPALDAVRGGGAFVDFTGGGPRGLRRIRVEVINVKTDGSALAALSALAGRGLLTLRVAETLPLSEAAKAHQRLAQGGLRGRLVLVP